MPKVADMPKGARFKVAVSGSVSIPTDGTYVSLGYVCKASNRLEVIDQYGRKRFVAGWNNAKLVAK